MTGAGPPRGRNVRDWVAPVIVLLVAFTCVFLLFRAGFRQLFPGG